MILYIQDRRRLGFENFFLKNDFGLQLVRFHCVSLHLSIHQPDCLSFLGGEGLGWAGGSMVGDCHHTIRA